MTMANSVFVHSSPPKAISGHAAAIRSFIKSGDLDKLESIVLEGQGARLLGLVDSTSDVRVKAWLRSVPSYMAKIDLLHEAVIRGSLKESQNLLDSRKLATSRDAVGRGLAHKAVLHGHKSLLEWMGRKYPETVRVRDNESRTPLHYTAALPSPTCSDFYGVLLNLGAPADLPDIHGKKALFYLQHPEDFDIEARSSSRSNSNKSPLSNSNSYSGGAKSRANTVTRAQIRIWIHEKDIGKLENIVWQGKGDKLLLETTNNSKVRRFLDNVPHLMSLIKQVHLAAVMNDIESLKRLKNHVHIEEIFTAKDQYGVTPLQKAVGLNNRDVVEWWLLEMGGSDEKDADGNGVGTYATDPGIQGMLRKAGIAVMSRKDVDVGKLRVVPDAPRVVGHLTSWDRDTPQMQSAKKRKSSIMLSDDEFGSKRRVSAEMEDTMPPFEENQQAEQAPLIDENGYDNDFENEMEPEKPEPSPEPEPELMEEAAPTPEPVPTKEVNGDVLASQDLAEDANETHEEAERAETENLEAPHEEQISSVTPPRGMTPAPPTENGFEEAMDKNNDSDAREFEELGNESRLEEELANLKEEDFEVDHQEEEEEPMPVEPPPGIPEMEEVDVDGLIQQGAMEPLVSLILDGNGAALLGKASREPNMGEFLHNVPAYMAKIASIHSAASNANLRELQQLLDRKRLALARDSQGRVPLHLAVLSEDVSVVRWLLSNFSQSINAVDKNARSPLHYAATLPDKGVIYKVLIEHGADPNLRDNQDNTPGIYLRRKDLLKKEDLLQEKSISSSRSRAEPQPQASQDRWSRPPTPQQEEAAGPPTNGTSSHISPEPELTPAQLVTLDQFYIQITKPDPLWLKTLKKILKKEDSRAKSYLQKFLTKELYESVKLRSTPRATLYDCIKYYPQYFLIAPDPHSYWVFRELFIGCIRDQSKRSENPGSWFLGLDLDPSGIPPLDVAAKFIREVRLRLSRNVRPYPFVSLLDREGLRRISAQVSKAVEKFGFQAVEMDKEEGDREGEEEVREAIVKMEASKISRFWPKHRVVHVSPSRNQQIWVHAEDHLDFVVKNCYGKVAQLLNELKDLYESVSLDYHYSSEVGFLTVDPFRAGTGLKIQFTVRLPHLLQDRLLLQDLCSRASLSIVKLRLEADELELENSVCFGYNEIELTERTVSGLSTLLSKEEEIGRELDAKASGIPAIWSEEGKYLADVLGDALVQGLTEVSTERPEDPVGYLAEFLKRYHNDQSGSVGGASSSASRRSAAVLSHPQLATAVNGVGGQVAGATGPVEPLAKAVEEQAAQRVKSVSREHTDDNENLASKLDSQLESDGDDDTDITHLDEVDDPEEGGEPSSQQSGTRSAQGQSVLHYAAARPGGASTILAFLQNPSVNLAWRDENLRTARDTAMELNRHENVRTIDGWLISLAVAGDVTSLTQLLLDGYSPFSVSDTQDNHIIDLAEKAGKREVALFLRGIPDFKKRLEQLHAFVKSGDLEGAKSLALADGRLAFALFNGRTALHLAVLCEDFPIVKWLVEKFDGLLKKGDHLDRTALHFAMGVEKVEKMTRLLVRNGAKRVVKDLKGRQPSYYFINREEIVNLQKQLQKS